MLFFFFFKAVQCLKIESLQCLFCFNREFLMTPVFKGTTTSQWRGHQSAPTVVSLKGRFRKKLQSKSAFSRKIVRYTVCFVMV